MRHYNYLIIGGGMTGDAATRGIRDVDPNGTIGMLAQEPDPPYSRPPLSKGLWQGRPVSRIWRKTAERGVDIFTNCAAGALNPAQKRVTSVDGEDYTFDRLLLATGGRPRTLPAAPAGDRVVYFRTYRDYERLRALAEENEHFAVVGGGYIGSELAASLATLGKRVSLVMTDNTINGAKYPIALGKFLNEYFQNRGVEIHPGQKVQAVESQGNLCLVRMEGTDGGRSELGADAVVLGLGIEPNVWLAQEAGLPVDNGILVDRQLKTERTDIYAAGDVASVFKPALGKRLRIEHEDNANAMGRRAGRNMAGEMVAYDYLPFFYSDLFDLSYEAVGELGGKLEMVEDWEEPFRRGVIYYLEAGRVRGVLLWGIGGKVDEARRLILEGREHHPEDLRGRIRP
jgi:3-phenylpropionate/trans-cinnamate dioxygenase ferredoxin reductase component